MTGSSSINKPSTVSDNLAPSVESIAPHVLPEGVPGFIYDRSYDQNWKKDVKDRKWNFVGEGTWEVAGDGPFERLVRDVLSGVRKSVAFLEKGIRACFASKNDRQWQEFFENVFKQGSSSVVVDHMTAEVREIIYRGSFADVKGLQLVGDIFHGVDKQACDKFARLPIKSDVVVLRELSSGELIPSEIISRWGDKISWTRLVHTVPDEPAHTMMNELKNPVSAESVRRLEHSLAMHSAKRDIPQMREVLNISSKGLLTSQKKSSFVWLGLAILTLLILWMATRFF